MAETADSVPATMAIEVENLRKRYGSKVALDGLSLRVPASSIVGLVGPNGAGKTTAVECMEGLKKPDGGTVRVLGQDPIHDRVRLYERVGVQLQESSMYGRIKVHEALRLFASFYPDPREPEELAGELGLGLDEGTYATLSGGQKRKLLIALALIGRPDVLFLDEPTTGLDPDARFAVWQLLARERARGAAVLVTTHYLEEAQEHCDEVVIVDRGRAVATGPPATLLTEHRLRLRIGAPLLDAPARAELVALPCVSFIQPRGDRLVVHGDGEDMYSRVSEALRAHGAPADEIEVRRGNLEDLFFRLTGHEFRYEYDQHESTR